MGVKCVFKAKAWLIKLSCLTGNLIQVYLSLCRKGKYVMFIFDTQTEEFEGQIYELLPFILCAWQFLECLR